MAFPWACSVILWLLASKGTASSCLHHACDETVYFCWQTTNSSPLLVYGIFNDHINIVMWEKTQIILTIKSALKLPMITIWFWIMCNVDTAYVPRHIYSHASLIKFETKKSWSSIIHPGGNRKNYTMVNLSQYK